MYFNIFIFKTTIVLDRIKLVLILYDIISLYLFVGGLMVLPGRVRIFRSLIHRYLSG